MRVALMVVPDEGERADVMSAADACGLRALLTQSVFEAIGLLGRADIGALVFPVGTRVLAVRGLCQLAIRHHPDIRLYAERCEGVDADAVLDNLQYPLVDLIDPGSLVDHIPDIAARMRRAPTFDELPPTNADEASDDGELYDDDEDTVVNAPAPVDLEIAPDTESGPHRLGVLPEDTLPHRVQPHLETPQQVDLGYAPEDAPTSPHHPFVLTADEPTHSSTGSHLAVSATLPSVPGASTEEGGGLVFDGELAETPGVKLLMTLCAQGLTGFLDVDDLGGVFFYAGDPVWAAHPRGPGGWLAEMARGGHIPDGATLERDPTNEAELISILMEQNLLKGQASHNLCRGLVSERLHAIVDAPAGGFSFTEQGDFLQTAPLVRVSLFGLLLSRLRVHSNPSELLRRSGELGELRVFPLPALASVAPRLNSFAGGHNLAYVIDGNRLGQEIWDELRLDPVTGVLLLTALIDSGLCTLNDEPMEQTGRFELTVPQARSVSVPYSDLDAPSSGEEEDSARDEIFTLYMRLKPLSLPRDVLGVPLDADLGAIEAAYEARMNALRPERIPAGSARQLMVARILELRDKVTKAYDALRLLGDSGEGESPW